MEGIHEINVYQKESDYFLVFDVDISFNSKKLMGMLKGSEGFLSFENSLSALGVVFPKHDQALERIYKLDQKVSYKPVEGQLKTTVKPYKRFVWTLLLEEDPELIAEYKKVHGIGQAWPEITANMKSVGVKDMEIYIHKEQVVLIMDTKPGFNLEEVGPKWQKLPREEEWQAYVAKFQRTDPESSIQEKWKDMIVL
ncbi:L-rhamnose mutarotase [Fulvivirga sp. M361]|uniref:L-rhamnose mutarotase n=1 Tax=Fulvivirga sp. M361 TaxID=2594266 RepID=UPI0016262D45|nr:L-rhamnose mutarotase [Fulvivirga sp. M361]